MQKFFDLYARCPLYPRKRTLHRTTVMSALCQKRTLADLTKSDRPRPPRLIEREQLCGQSVQL